MDNKNIELFCQILSRETGITFPVSRYAFVYNRLTTLFEKYKCNDLTDLMGKGKHDPKIRIDMLNVLTTNETWFFRHPEQFEILKKKVIPDLLARKKDKVINIWSAGCSIGAELYSILITLLETIPASTNFRINLLGSDISYDAISLARKGVYDSRDLRMTDRTYIQKYFDQIDFKTFKIKEDLKTYVNFEFLNLLETWPPRTFDIIFCRNTMIYFNEDSKNLVVSKLFKALELNGYFFTSANEQIDLNEEKYGIQKIFLENDVVYQKCKSLSSACELYFNTPSDLLKATNHLRRNAYNFQFGNPSKLKNGNNVRCIIIRASDCEKIIRFLSFNGIEITRSICIKR